MCVLRVPFVEHVYPQPSASQANGRSPVCVRACATMLLFFSVEYPHPGCMHDISRGMASEFYSNRA